MELITVIIRTLFQNKSKLNRAVKSVLNQTYQNVQLLVVVDTAAVSKCPEIKEWFALLPAKNNMETYLLFSNLGKGRANTANFGLNYATGSAICFLDDDDFLFDDHLSLLCEELTNTSAIAVVANSLYNDKIPFDQNKQAFFKQDLKMKNLFPIQAVLFRNLGESLPRFDDSLQYLEDWDFWLRLMDQGHFEHTAVTTSHFFIPSSFSVRLMRSMLHRRYRSIVLSKHKFGPTDR